MFLILGLPWILESLHQLVDGNHTHLDEEGATTRDSKCDNSFREVFFRIASCFNMLRGVLLFLIFPCKASIWRKLVARHLVPPGAQPRTHQEINENWTK